MEMHEILPSSSTACSTHMLWKASLRRGPCALICFTCMNVLSALFVHHCVLCVSGDQKRALDLQDWVYRREPTYRCWKLSSGPLNHRAICPTPVTKFLK